MLYKGGNMLSFLLPVGHFQNVEYRLDQLLTAGNTSTIIEIERKSLEKLKQLTEKFYFTFRTLRFVFCMSF